ncbi:MAG TPA: DUF4352 domain-containing protein [Dictyoglomaceae bacterium]|nr:DUF4352 domain-containing protein [Dictyoglomaceae bacterium]HOL39042.1 DUF4352 domain-containing protein [Dictyoglomaceae bacterium]HOP94381.1 DUF4352 domain-containing protein [Dictyoglomaceae bacterium]HPP15782.1 DUF4352 domain-containing protein [Dictyoglomaceae bacterium]HPU42771.1 DUF4352 domain-containing protein [Dictyoglomaceae bacterium]
MKKIFLLIFLLSIVSLSFAETVPLIIDGKEVKGENIDGVIVYIASVVNVIELPLVSGNIGSASGSIKPEESFWKFEIFIYNKTDKEILITQNNLQLIDEDWKKYFPDISASIYYAINGEEVFFRKYLKPGELAGGILVYDVSKSSKPYRLNILDIPTQGKSYHITIKI